jgi:hypothetical protein
MKTIMVLAAVALLPGCASLEYAGNSSYSVKPWQDAYGRLHCCDVQVHNGKEMAAVHAHIRMTKDGDIEVDLQEQGVTAFEGQRIASVVAQDTAKAGLSAAAIAGGVLVAPAVAPALAAAISSGGLPAAAAGAAVGASAASAFNK